MIGYIPEVHKTFLVSFPRSGHHMLVRGLFTILPEVLVYSEGYKSPHNFENCRFVNLQKDHDLELKHEIREEFKYIVLTRSPGPAIESWHKMLARFENIPPDWEEFREEKVEFYLAWHKKWISDNPNKANTKIIQYQDLTRNKSATVCDTAAFMGVPGDKFTDKLEALGRWKRGEDSFKDVTI